MKNLALLIILTMSFSLGFSQVNFDNNDSDTEAINYVNATLYPNPSKGYFSIKMKDDTPYDVAIYAMNGMLVYNQQNIEENNLRLDISDIVSKGFYHVRINQNGNAVIKKLVIQ